MLGLILLLVVGAIVAGVLGFTGLIIGAAVIAKVIFFIFFVLLVISLIALFFK